MNTQTKQKRLARIQAALGHPDDTSATPTTDIHVVCGVTDLDQAVERAHQASAQRVLFLPQHRSAQFSRVARIGARVTPGVAFAFEGTTASQGQLDALKVWSYSTGADETTARAVRFLSRMGVLNGTSALSGEQTIIARGDNVMFHLPAKEVLPEQGTTRSHRN
jgi:hypothetical protein